MNKLFKAIKPEWFLRVGFGLMYIYSGQSLIRTPASWIWALPSWFIKFVSNFVDISTYLRFQGVVEIIIAVLLFAWFVPPKIFKYIALISAIEMAGILAFSGIDLITFRDIGLLGGACTLFLIYWQKADS